MTVNLTYDSQLSRVRVSATALSLSAATADIERSTDQVTWALIRGGNDVPVVSGEITPPVDDYEFAADVVNFYRITAHDSAGGQTNQETASITPDLQGEVWVKVVARPFLNQPVIVADFLEVRRAARAGVFPVVGRSFPVAVSDLAGSRQYTLRVLTETLPDAANIDLILATGEPVFVHVPDGSQVPGGYFSVGDSTQQRTSRKTLRRIFDLPLTEVAAPGPDVVGATVTWQGVLNAFATWQAVLTAEPTWADLLQRIGEPTDVIVP